MHVVYGSWFSWRHEWSVRFDIGGSRFFPRVFSTMNSKRFVQLGIVVYFVYYRKYEVKMTRILFKFIVYPSLERVLKTGRVESKTSRQSSLNYPFGKRGCPILDFTTPKSNGPVLLQISLRFQVVIFNNSFGFCVAGLLELGMSSFCSIPWAAGWFLLKEIIKRTRVFYNCCLIKYLLFYEQHFCKQKPGCNWHKIKQKPRNTPKLSFC